MSSRKRKGTGIDVDRLGSWYQPSKVRKLTPVDKVTAIMAPRNSVTGAQARDQLMTKTLAKAPKVGNRMFKRVRGGKVGRKRTRKGKGWIEYTSTQPPPQPKLQSFNGSEPYDIYSTLDNSDKEAWNQPIRKSGRPALWEILQGADWNSYVHQAEQAGIEPTDDNYRVFRLEKWFKNRANDKYSGIGGFFRGIGDAWKNAAPQAFADAANIVGRVLPGASNITDRIEDALSDGRHSWEELGGPTEKLINGAVDLAGSKVHELSKKGGRVYNLMRQPTKISNRRGNGMVYPIPDIKLQPELAKIIAMASGSSPLDHTEKESLSNLQKHHYNLIKNYKHHRKLPGLNPRRKITKGGRTFVSLRNILVTPEAAP